MFIINAHTKVGFYLTIIVIMIILHSIFKQIVVDLAARSSYATLNEIIILAEHHPSSAGQQMFATLPETIIVAEDENTKAYEFDEVCTDCSRP